MPMQAMQPTFEDLELLTEVSRLLNETDFDTVLKKIIGLAARAVGATEASLFMHDSGRVDWEHVFTMRNLRGDESVKVISRVLDEGFAGWVYRHQQGDIIGDTLEDPRWIVFDDDTVVARSVLCVPFISEEQVVAVVTLVHDQPHHFTPYHLRLLTIIANQATIAIRNARLFAHLTQQRRQLETILQSIGDALIVVDAEARVVLVNDAALRLLNQPDTERVLGTDLHHLMEEDVVFAPILAILDDQPDDSRTQWSFFTQSHRANTDYQGTMTRWVEPMMGIVGHVIVLHDVTELQDLSRFKDEMLRVASHDLRSPLALITGYADMVLLDTPDKESPVIEYVDIIKHSVERMGSLIEDLLRVERVRSNPLELQTALDPETLVKQVLVNMRLPADARQQKLQSRVQLTGAPNIVADTVLLRQAMENLVGNAIKYTPSQGKITVAAWFDEQRFYFSVQDTGIGIASEHQGRVFESFYRVPSLAQMEKGSGLGLSLVQNVIQRHGGEVWLESEVGVGSEFGFWLPLARPLQATS